MRSPSAQTKLESADYRKKLLSAVHLLPPLPTVLNQLLRILNDSNCTSGQIAAIIEKDAVLSGSVLRCVNSAYYGLPSRVSSIRHSVTLLGFATVRNLAMAFSMRQMLAKPKLPSKKIFADYSQHSLGCAIMTQFLAHYTRTQDPEAAFAAGLFHDIGKLLMYTTLPEMIPVLLEHWEESGASFEDSEKELLHVTHSELSGIVLDKWKLPQAVRDACRYHHDPSACPEESDDGSVSLAHLVHASDLYVKSYGLEILSSEKRPSEPPDEAFREIGLEDALPELLERFKAEFQSIRNVFH
jgi:putative nucleotidyltransferase with HDIG domain